MKKLLALCLILVSLFTFTACGQTSNKSDSSTTQQVEENVENTENSVKSDLENAEQKADEEIKKVTPDTQENAGNNAEGAGTDVEAPVDQD